MLPIDEARRQRKFNFNSKGQVDIDPDAIQKLIEAFGPNVPQSEMNKGHFAVTKSDLEIVAAGQNPPDQARVYFQLPNGDAVSIDPHDFPVRYAIEGGVHETLVIKKSK